MSPDASGVGLPLPASRFIGRSAELARLDALFGGEARLVTLWGAAGIGKTRLALEFAAERATLIDPTARAFYCDLSEARDVLGICAALGRALDLALPPEASGAVQLSEQLGALLRDLGPSLMVLDNFEHVVGAASATVVGWLKQAPKMRFLVTSRERLRVDAEVVEEVGPMGVTTDDGEAPEALQLFVDRAEALGFHVDAESARLAGELVTALEGIPLAIELAAGRVDTLGIEGMLDPIGRTIRRRDAAPSSAHPRLEVLAAGRRDAIERQRTLRNAIAWSWELLTAHERRGLAQCAVFRGGFTPAAAGHVLDLDDGAPPVLEVIQSLRDKSLLRSYQVARGQIRLALFESVREFAATELEALGEADAAAARHEAFFLDIAPRLANRGPEGDRLLSLEVDNLMSIAERSLDVTAAPSAAQVAAGLRALVAVERVFVSRGPIAHYLEWLDRGLTLAEDIPHVDLHVRGMALQVRGRALPQVGRTDDGIADLRAALEAARSGGNRTAKGNILTDLGVLYQHARDMDRARDHYERALAVHRGLGDRRAIARLLGNLGALHHDLKDLDQAETYYVRALAMFREMGDRRIEGLLLKNLGALHQERGDLAEAERHLQQALVLLEEVRDHRLAAIALGNLGALHHEQSRLSDAREAHLGALSLIRQVGDRRSEGLCLSRLGAVLATEGHIAEATKHLDEAQYLLMLASDPIALEVVAVSRAFVHLAQAVAARTAKDEAAAAANLREAHERIARARAGGLNKPAPAEVNDDIRIAIRILEPALERLDTGATEALAPPLDVMLIGPDANWLRPPHGAWQDLRRRRALRLILMRLVQQYEADEAALSIDALREAGWPGESMSHEAAVNRVHVALAELRKRGLKGVLRKGDGGYSLDRRVELRRVPSALCPS